MASHILDKGTSHYVFTTWSGVVKCAPEKYFEPETLEELRQILSAARLHHKKVKVIGKCHSFGSLATTEGYMISLTKINKIKKIDSSGQTVTAECGITLGDLQDRLEQEGLALSVFPNNKDVSLGGAISNAVHGTGINYMSFSSYVLELELLTASGEVMTLSRENDSEAFKAACISFGALGVIVSVKLQCVPKYNITMKTYGLQLQDMLENISVHEKSSEHFQFGWYPYADGAVAFHIDRGNKPPSPPPSAGLWSKLIDQYLLPFSYWITSYFPSLMPRFSRFFYNRAAIPQEITFPGLNWMPAHMFLSQNAIEWAIPKDKVALVIYEMKKWILENKFPAHFPIYGFSAKAEDLTLSTAYKSDVYHICVLANGAYGTPPDHTKFFRAFSKIALNVGGRVHWASAFEDLYSHVPTMHPGLNAFLKVRQRLDPDGMFLNDALSKMFTIESPSN